MQADTKQLAKEVPLDSTALFPVRGREDEADAIATRALEQRNVRGALINVHGLPGMGKSTLLKYVHQRHGTQGTSILIREDVLGKGDSIGVLGRALESSTHVSGLHKQVRPMLDGYFKLGETVELTDLLEGLASEIKDPTNSGLIGLLFSLFRLKRKEQERDLARIRAAGSAQCAVLAYVGSKWRSSTQSERPLLLIDPGEQFEIANRHGNGELLPLLTQMFVVVLATRQPIDTVGQELMVVYHQVPPLSRKAAIAVACDHHPDETKAERIVDRVGGYPLLIVLAAEAFRLGASMDLLADSEANDLKVADGLLQWLCKNEPNQLLREFLLKGSFLPTVDAHKIGIILEVAQSEAIQLFQELKDKPYFTGVSDGLRWHEQIRDLLRKQGIQTLGQLGTAALMKRIRHEFSRGYLIEADVEF